MDVTIIVRSLPIIGDEYIEPPKDVEYNKLPNSENVKKSPLLFQK